jgi:hypothetical protein
VFGICQDEGVFITPRAERGAWLVDLIGDPAVAMDFIGLCLRFERFKGERFVLSPSYSPHARELLADVA